MALTWDFKDPDEVLDYEVDWTDRLAGDTISASLWEVPEGIEMDSEDFSSTKTTIWLSGGTLGERYSLLNRITTAGGRVMDATVRLPIKAR